MNKRKYVATLSENPIFPSHIGYQFEVSAKDDPQKVFAALFIKRATFQLFVQHMFLRRSANDKHGKLFNFEHNPAGEIRPDLKQKFGDNESIKFQQYLRQETEQNLWRYFNNNEEWVQAYMVHGFHDQQDYYEPTRDFKSVPPELPDELYEYCFFREIAPLVRIREAVPNQKKRLFLLKK